METDVHPGANGSARVVLGQGATEVLAVVKVRECRGVCVCVCACVDHWIGECLGM